MDISMFIWITLATSKIRKIANKNKVVKTNAMRIVDADLVAIVVTSFTKTCEVYFWHFVFYFDLIFSKCVYVLILVPNITY